MVKITIFELGVLNMQPKELEDIKITDNTTCMQLDGAYYDCFMEIGVRNYTPEEILMVSPDGHMVAIPPCGVTASGEVGLEITQIHRIGRHTVNTTMKGSSITYSNVSMPQRLGWIPNSLLQRGPVFYSPLGRTFALRRYESMLTRSNIYSPDFHVDAINRISLTFFDRDKMGGPAPTPLLIFANSHNTNIKKVYVAVNDRIMSFAVAHRLETPESIVFSLNEIGGANVHPVPNFAWGNAAVCTEVIDGVEWLYGTDLTEVQKQLTARITKQAAKLDPELLDSHVRAKTAEVEQQLAANKATMANLKTENDLLKQTIKNLEKRVEQAESETQSSMKQKEMFMDYEKQRMSAEKMRFEQERAAAEAEAKRAKESADRTADNWKYWVSVVTSVLAIVGTVITLFTKFTPPPAKT